MSNTPEASKPSLLLVEDDALLAEALAAALDRRGYAATVCATAQLALAQLRAAPPQLAVVDLRLPDASGLSIVSALHDANPLAAIVVLTGYANIPPAIEAIKLGARNYLCKPVSAEAVIAGLVGEQASTLLPLGDVPLPQLEWQHIQRVRAEHQNNISATARALGKHRRTLQRKLSRHAGESGA